MKFATPSDELIEKFGLGEAARNGAIVTEVAPTSPAAKQGLRPGDVITDAKAVADAIAKTEKGKGVRFYVESPDGKRFVFVKPAAAK